LSPRCREEYAKGSLGPRSASNSTVAVTSSCSCSVRVRHQSWKASTAPTSHMRRPSQSVKKDDIPSVEYQGFRRPLALRTGNGDRCLHPWQVLDRLSRLAKPSLSASHVEVAVMLLLGPAVPSPPLLWRFAGTSPPAVECRGTPPLTLRPCGRPPASWPVPAALPVEAGWSRP
jgi:hypothetical protein